MSCSRSNARAGTSSSPPQSGGIPASHPLHVGHVGRQVGCPFGNQFFLGSDLVLGIGCRFNDRHTGDVGVYTQGRRFIHVNIEPSHIGRIIPTELGIVSDAGLALDALLAQDPHSRVACETLVTTDLIVVSGEITTKAVIDYQKVARDTIADGLRALGAEVDRVTAYRTVPRDLDRGAGPRRGRARRTARPR